MFNTVFFPMTSSINQDVSKIEHALKDRSYTLRQQTKKQNILARITFIAIPLIGLAAGLLVLASLPVAIISFATTTLPLKIFGISLLLAMTSLALNILFNPNTPGELIIKNHWKALFIALRKGDGANILKTCQELAKQREIRAHSFAKCLGTLPADETTPFFHKACLVGYLLLMIQYLRKEDHQGALSNGQLALTHFPNSAFPEDVKKFIKLLQDHPQRVIHKLKDFPMSKHPLHTIDCLISQF